MPLTSDTFLRRAEREDLDTIVEWMDDPDFLRFLYGDPARSQRQIRENILTMLGRSAAQGMPSAIYLIIDSPKGGLVGLASLQSISWRNRSCSVDLYIGNKTLRSRGVAAVAMYRTLEYCFDELNLHRVGAFIYSFNKPSWRLIELSGAVRELTLREHVSRDGQLYDLYCYGLLRQEFDKLRQDWGDRQFGKSLMDMAASWEKGRDAAEAAS